MTGSNWVDLLVIAVAIASAMSGWRHGAIASALSFLGVLAGAAVGVALAPHLVASVTDPRGRVLAGILTVVVLVVAGQVLGMYGGRWARRLLARGTVRAVDSTVGAMFQAVAVLVIAWLLAIPLASSSQPAVASAVRGSWVLKNVNAVAPDWMRAVPSRLAALLDDSGLPDVLGPFSKTPITDVAPPDLAIADSALVADARPSVLEILGSAPSCQRALEGTGFVVSPERVMTNAHVLAGTNDVVVQSADGPLAATVVLFDPDIDIAVLDVPGLRAPALSFTAVPAHSGAEAVVLGYPGGGPFTASAARIRDTIRLSGPDIHNSDTVTREVYTIRGQVRSGNSGGPLMGADGNVLGVVFGAAADDSDTGFALTAAEVRASLDASADASRAVSTGSCVT